ncbi:hypothetical protein QEJ31_06165 [Pigmentibacter sp. JX0631]|uniref:hypothetical protein n=1 Tax=Pigmentibacter sp. JX0631 TaxID=2976982 RepID=UPI002468FE88|nr:hypothetical protein [Pigmentibacter sp. JX0631]WGL61180.1 hypothetical protein QEJ31_06165 [Pigmentibacter sp. JX0631]
MNFPIQKYLQTHIPNELISCIESLENQCEKGDFSAWSIANNKYAFSAFWIDECCISKNNFYQLNTPLIHPYFDISSLTKPLFLNLYLRMKFKSDFLKIISTPLNDIFLPKNTINENDCLIEFILRNDNNFNLNSFLSHYSGAKNWFWMGIGKWQHKNTYISNDKEIYQTILDHNEKNYSNIVKENLNNTCLKYFKNEQFSEFVYSDINYYILSRLIESFFMRESSWIEILNELNEKVKTKFFHASLTPNETKKSIPFYPYISAYKDNFAGTETNLFGNVSDTNANILSSFSTNTNIVSGHSGYFGTISDVKLATEELAHYQKNYLENIGYIHDKNVRFVYGLDTPTSKDSTCGILNWPKDREYIYGHLGYSGTSLWFSTKNLASNKNSQQIILTNRLASRTKFGVDSCPRIYSFTDYLSNTNIIFIKEKDKIEQISSQEFFDLNTQYFGMYKKIWDINAIRLAPNINEVRRNIGLKLWEL